MLAKVIRDSEHEHHVISLKPRGVIADEMLGSTYYVGWKVWKIYKLVNYLSPDVLMTWLYHSDLIGLILGRLAGVPRIIWNIRCSDMNYRIWNYQWWLRKLCALLSDIPTMIVINSMQSKEFHKQIGYNPTIWKVIPNGFDTDEFKPYLRAKKRLKDYLGLKGDVKLIGMVARNHPMKDYRTFIRAAVQILNTRKDVHFVMAGKDVGNDTVETNFHTLGERHDMHLIYPAFDVLCMTSALWLWKDAPFFGHGIWSYRKQVYEAQAEINKHYPEYFKDYVLPKPRRVHCDYLETLVAGSPYIC